MTTTDLAAPTPIARNASGGGLFSFPHPVNEVSARLVAGTVVVLSVLTIALDQPWLIAVIAYGFVARVLTGPTLSPLGQIVTRWVTPRLPFAPKFVPGPPKRFAQGIGAVFSLTAAVLAFGFGEIGAAYVVLGLLAAATDASEREADHVRRTRIILVGDADWATNDFLGEGGNSRFFIQSMDWLTLDEDLVSVTTNLAAFRPLNLSPYRLTVARGTLAGGVPAFFILSGGVVWLSRRRA